MSTHPYTNTAPARPRKTPSTKASATESAERKQLVNNFFLNASHELRTPLAVLLMMLDMMDIHLSEADCQHADRIQAVSFEMRRSVYRLVHLIDNMLVAARIDAGLEESCLVCTDIVALTASIAEAADAYLRGSIHVSFSSVADSLTIPADAHKLGKILMNLLSNAAKHSPAGGCVRVSLETKPGRVCFSVSDEGCGIPADKRSVLFDRFRPTESLARSNEGFGIGLSLTRSMVELLGGSIRAESRPEKGATFFVELPIAAEESPMTCQTADSLTLEQQIQIAFSDVYPADIPAPVYPSG